MDIITQTRIGFLEKLIAAYEREHQYEHPAYLAALQELAHLQPQTNTKPNQRPASITAGRFDSHEEYRP